MPIEPSVFHPIRPNDYQQRPFYAYKNYAINNINFSTESGYVRHDAIYLGFPEPVRTDIQNSLEFAGTNVEDNTQKTVVWSTIDHKYYRHPYDPAKSFEHTNADTTEKFLWYSASILTFPYFQTGEKIKPGSVTGSFNVGDTYFKLIDDGLGNLRDPLVATESFASESKSILHLSFNGTFRQFKDVEENLGEFRDGLPYKMGRATRFATPSEVRCKNLGVTLTGSIIGGTDPYERSSGLAAHFTERSSYIRIAHSKEFNRFQNCDDWTIAFWIKKVTTGSDTRHILSKGGVFEEQFLDEVTTFQRRPPRPHIQVHGPGHAHHGKGRKNPVPAKVVLEKRTSKILKKRDRNVPLPDILSSYKKFRTPFMIGVQTTAETDLTHYHFRASDGGHELHISASTNTTGVTSSIAQGPASAWDHVVVRNSASLCQFFINGELTGQSGSLPSAPTANKADVMIGAVNTMKNFLPNTIKRLNLTETEEISVYEVSGSLTTVGTLNVGPGVLMIVRGDMFINAPTVTVQAGGTLKVFGDIIESDPGFLVVESGGTVIVAGATEDFNDYYLSEFRMYSYPVNQVGISSLANRDYISGSLYQTNVAGNVFYRNLQTVISSPMPKYNSGSGAFNESFELKYKGTHKIYENEVLVRVPADNCNVPMNPTANYIPSTGNHCPDDGKNSLPGEFRKPMFVSGTVLPYVTTIGLYDDQAQLLAVGKCAQPIQKRSDVDMNFIVRWDY